MAGPRHRGRVLRCPDCGRDVPEVLGADAQECPHCGAEVLALGPAPRAEGAGLVDAAGAAAEAFRFARRHYGGVLLLWVPALVVDVAAALGVGYYEASHPIPAAGDPGAQAAALSYLGVALPSFLLLVALNLALFAPTGGYVLDRTGVTPPGKSALAAAARAPLLLLALGLVLTLVYLGGALLALVGLLVFYHWFQFAPVALAHRRKGLGDAFEASRRFARERRVFGFTALSFFALLAAFLAQVLLSAGADALLRLLHAQNLWTEAVAGWAPAWLVTPFLAILPAAYWSLAERAPAQAATPAAAPEAAPSGGFRTTKCPQCGTLVPYVATGAPVDVECPVCGRKGRVL